MATVKIIKRGGSGYIEIQNVPAHEAREMEANYKTPGHVFRIEGAHGTAALAAEEILSLGVQY